MCDFCAVHCIFHISTVTTCDTFWEYLVKLHSLLHISICEVLLSGANDCDFKFFMFHSLAISMVICYSAT
jgi:hypothetical protein